MAGIGFELRKIFEKDSVYSKIKGVAFATMTVIGPTIIFILMLLGINFVMDAFKVTQFEQRFFSSACLYIFILAIIISSMLNTISSRFVSDMIFQKKEEAIPSAMFGSIFLGAIASSICAFIICLTLFFKYEVDLVFLCGYYLLAVMITVVYTAMTFVSAIKEYTKITWAFFLGMFSGVLLFFILYWFADFEVITCIIYAMAVGFLVINVIIMYYVLSFFGNSDRKYFEFTRYFSKYPLLFLSGVFYILGLYVSNIIYWFYSDVSTQIMIFHVAPTYDIATFLAILVNLSAMVIFTVKVETQFFEKYRQYVTSLTKANYAIIEKARKIMSYNINVQLFFIYEVQLIITIILTCISILIFPMFGLGGLTLDFFLMLGISMFVIFSMYFTVVFLYYFDDQVGSCGATGIFFGVTIITSIIALDLGTAYYAVAPLIGGLAGWIYAFVRLRNLLNDVNVRLFCKVI